MKKLLFLLIALSLCMGLTIPTYAANFTDVPEGTYYTDAVEWAVETGVTQGVTRTEFQPNTTCTRGQVVTFLWRANGKPEPKTTKNPYSDVNSSSPFYKAILWASENGITTGTTATTFNPSGTCTSAHVVTFLWRANGKPAASGGSALANTYPNAYYTDALAWADSAGLLDGVGYAFVPNQNSPRANIVTYLYRDNRNCERFNSEPESKIENSSFSLTSSKTNISLDDYSETTYITLLGADIVNFDIGNPNVVTCEWGEWDGDTIPLTFTPVATGNTVVTVFVEGHENSAIVIDVSVYKPTGADMSSLTIIGVGEELETASGAYMNISIINSVDYEISYYESLGSMDIEVDVIATMVKLGDPPAFGGYGYIGINYELINEEGVYVETGNLWIDANYLNRQYSQKIFFVDLEPGNYTLNFRDNYL